jgi:hypothetical protein
MLLAAFERVGEAPLKQVQPIRRARGPFAHLSPRAGKIQTTARITMSLIQAPASPRDHARLVAGLMAKMPETDDELFAPNDNGISGAAAHSFPAMRLCAKDKANRALLAVLTHLFELAAEPADSVPSPSGMYRSPT